MVNTNCSTRRMHFIFLLRGRLCLIKSASSGRMGLDFKSAPLPHCWAEEGLDIQMRPWVRIPEGGLGQGSEGGVMPFNTFHTHPPPQKALAVSVITDLFCTDVA